MRVIAGSASGHGLTPPPKGTRPTMDRVRAAIFSSLGERVPNSHVLDLFCGSGAMGIEALSRGAHSAEFVDNARAAAQSVRQNLRITRLEGKAHEMDAFKFLSLYAQDGQYDIIFADPPYDKRDAKAGYAERLLADAHLPLRLAEDGIFVLEKNARMDCAIPAPWSERHRKRYGDTEVLYLSRE